MRVVQDLPHEPESYVHRIGRTARAGASGIAISFCDPGERSQLRAIERLIKRPLDVVGDAPKSSPSAAGKKANGGPPRQATSNRKHRRPKRFAQRAA